MFVETEKKKMLQINVMESSGVTPGSENEAVHSDLDVSEKISAPSPTASISTIASTSTGHGSAPKRLPKRKNNEDLTKEVLQSVKDHFKQPTYKEDRYDIIGKMVALKLREFKNKQQQLLAEKIINETLFEAEMGNLTMSHRVMAPRTMILNDIQLQSSISTSMPSLSHNSIPSPSQYTSTPNQSPITQPQYYAVTRAPQTPTIDTMSATTVQLSTPDWTEDTAGSYVSRFVTNTNMM